MASHPNLVHRDDVEPVRRDLGDFHWTRRKLAAAAGAHRVGLSHFEVDPGARTFPPHVHSDEEEWSYVLSGTGSALHDERAFAVRAGDVLLHRVDAEAHTFVAGDEGLELLVFGSGSETQLTFQPRTQTYWAGRHFLPPQGPHPLEADVALGPLELPSHGARPETVRHLDELGAEEDEDAGYRGRERAFRRLLGGTRSGLRWAQLDPGQLSCPPHWHQAEEECFVVLEGSGRAWLGEERHDLRPGHVLVRPPGTGVAHAIEAGAGGITYLAYGQHRPDELVYYPRSRKVGVGGGLLFRVEPLAYLDGEPEGAG